MAPSNIYNIPSIRAGELNFIPSKPNLDPFAPVARWSGYIPDSASSPENSVHNPYIRTDYIQVSGLGGSASTVNLFSIDFSEFTPSIDNLVTFTSARVYMKHTWNQPSWFKSFNVLDILLRKSTQNTNPYVFEPFLLANDIVYSPDRNVPVPLVGGIVNTNPTTPEVQLKVTHDTLAPTGGLILTTSALVKFNM